MVLGKCEGVRWERKGMCDIVKWVMLRWYEVVKWVIAKIYPSYLCLVKIIKNQFRHIY